MWKFYGVLISLVLFSSCGGNRTNFNKQKFTSLKHLKTETYDSVTEENKLNQYQHFDIVESDIELLEPEVEIENLSSYSYSQPEKDQFDLDDISSENLAEFENTPGIERSYDSEFVRPKKGIKSANKKKIGTGGKITLLYLALALIAGLTALACTLTFYASSSVGATVFVGILGLLAGAFILFLLIKQTRNLSEKKRRNFWVINGVIAGLAIVLTAVMLIFGGVL